MFEFVPGTTMVRPTDWCINDEPDFVIPRDSLQTDGEYYIGQFYSLYFPDTYWETSAYDADTVRQMLYAGDWEPLLSLDGLTIRLQEIEFKIGQRIDGSSYPVYKSVKNLALNLSAD